MLVLRNDCNLSYSENQNHTGVPLTTIRRIISSAQPRHNINLRWDQAQKLKGCNVRRLVQAVTSFKDKRKVSYLKLAKEVGI